MLKLLQHVVHVVDDISENRRSKSDKMKSTDITDLDTKRKIMSVRLRMKGYKKTEFGNNGGRACFRKNTSKGTLIPTLMMLLTLNSIKKM